MVRRLACASRTTGRPGQQAADEFEIVDTVGDRVRAGRARPRRNPFAYQPAAVGGESAPSVLPDPESGAGGGPIQGSLLLFKLNTSVYSNRPLELEIVPPDGGEPSTVELDL